MFVTDFHHKMYCYCFPQKSSRKQFRSLERVVLVAEGVGRVDREEGGRTRIDGTTGRRRGHHSTATGLNFFQLTFYFYQLDLCWIDFYFFTHFYFVELTFIFLHVWTLLNWHLLLPIRPLLNLLLLLLLLLLIWQLNITRLI